MANTDVKDYSGDQIYMKSTGAGTDADPKIPEHKETSAAAILADTTAILAKIVASAATEAKQDVMETSLDAIVAKLSANPATQTTLAAILAKIIAAPATEAKQDTLETTLNAIQAAVEGATPAGSNAIGKLAANSGVDIGDVDVTSQPARDNATDTITASLDTNVIMNDTTALTPKYEVIDDAVSGDNTIVAAVAGKKIRVLAINLLVSAAVTVRFEDGAGGSALTGQYQFGAQGDGIVLPFNPVGWFETTANTLLNMELSGAVSVDGSLVYVEV